MVKSRMRRVAELSLETVDDGEIRGFVTDLYEIFVAREPDSAGLNHYVERLKSGAPISVVVEAFASSDEFKERLRREFLARWAASRRPTEDERSAPDNADAALFEDDRFPLDYEPPGEAGRCYVERLRSGFLAKYCGGPVVLDVGYSGYDNPDKKPALLNAIGIDLDYPGYDGIRLPFDDGSVDTVFSSHCLEHILADHAAIRDWFRVLRVGGFIVCMVPSQALYEKKRFLPSNFNADHKRMYTPSVLAQSFEVALATNSYRIRHLAENDKGFNYALGPEVHSDGAYEIEIVIEKIQPPAWELA
jgi:hypothetical protein